MIKQYINSKLGKKYHLYDIVSTIQHNNKVVVSKLLEDVVIDYTGLGDNKPSINEINQWSNNLYNYSKLGNAYAWIVDLCVIDIMHKLFTLKLDDKSYYQVFMDKPKFMHTTDKVIIQFDYTTNYKPNLKGHEYLTDSIIKLISNGLISATECINNEHYNILGDYLSSYYNGKKVIFIGKLLHNPTKNMKLYMNIYSHQRYIEGLNNNSNNIYTYDSAIKSLSIYNNNNIKGKYIQYINNYINNITNNIINIKNINKTFIGKLLHNTDINQLNNTMIHNNITGIYIKYKGKSYMISSTGRSETSKLLLGTLSNISTKSWYKSLLNFNKNILVNIKNSNILNNKDNNKLYIYNSIVNLYGIEGIKLSINYA